MSKEPGKPSESLVQELLAERRQLKVALERARLEVADAPAACLEREDQADNPDDEPDDPPQKRQEEQDAGGDGGQHPKDDVDHQCCAVDDSRLSGVVLYVRVVLADKQKDEAADRWEQSPGKDRVQVLVAGRATWRCAHWRGLPWWRRRDLRHRFPPLMRLAICAPIIGLMPRKRHTRNKFL